MSKATRDVPLEELPDSKDSAPETKDDKKTHKPPTLDFMPPGMTMHLQAAPSTFGKIKESGNSDMGNKTAHIEVQSSAENRTTDQFRDNPIETDINLNGDWIKAQLTPTTPEEGAEQ